MKSLLFTAACDSSRRLISAIDANKGTDYYCPACHGFMILRKSGKTGPGSKRPHFAHKTLTPNCKPETVLHFAFKNMLAAKLEENLNNETPLSISWECEHCFDTHSGNLLKKVSSVKVEENLGTCKPDIALLDSTGKVICVIEIIVTHKPEPAAIAFYNKNGIICIEIELTSDDDINNLESKICTPNKVSICFNPKCPKCNNYQVKRTMYIIEGWCWKCDFEMKIAAIKIPMSSAGPSDFNQKEIQLARSKGVFLKSQYSKTTRTYYLANTCINCNAFAGEHYLFAEFIAPACRNELQSESFSVGYECIHCEGKESFNSKLN